MAQCYGSCPQPQTSGVASTRWELPPEEQVEVVEGRRVIASSLRVQRFPRLRRDRCVRGRVGACGWHRCCVPCAERQPFQRVQTSFSTPSDGKVQIGQRITPGAVRFGTNHRAGCAAFRLLRQRLSGPGIRHAFSVQQSVLSAVDHPDLPASCRYTHGDVQGTTTFDGRVYRITCSDGRVTRSSP